MEERLTAFRTPQRRRSLQRTQRFTEVSLQREPACFLAVQFCFRDTFLETSVFFPLWNSVSSVVRFLIFAEVTATPGNPLNYPNVHHYVELSFPRLVFLPSLGHAPAGAVA